MSLMNWLEHRTGLRSLLHEALYERVPGGARWRYVWGSSLVFAFMVQAITGIFLWMAYSPSGQTAWESVYFIQYEMQYGWLLRGLHHFMAQAMVVLLALHFLQIVIDGAYRAPREVNFWLGLVLMQIVLGMSLTGYLLPWDQKGYWATRVATNLMGLVPAVGPQLQQLVVGGADYGHHTLTRFFAMHAGLLPMLLIVFLAVHLALFRRHGVHAKDPHRKPDTTFWPDQLLRDAVVCLAVLAVVLFLTCKPLILGEPLGDRPGEHLGAHLGAPADPAVPYSAARPEWYFLFLFQFLKYFEGDSEVIGALVVPGAIMGFMFLMPLIGRWRLGHGFNVAFTLGLLLGIALLTGQAWWDDNMAAYDVEIAMLDPEGHKREESARFLEAVEGAQRDGARAVQLASSPQGISSAGAIELLRNDPKSQGPVLFAQYCASCHSHVDADGKGIQAEEVSAPNLYGFGSRRWAAGLLDPERIVDDNYFGKTAHSEGDMVSFIVDTLGEVEAKKLEQIAAALSAEAQLPAQQKLDEADAADIEAGRELMAGDIVDGRNCIECHRFGEDGELGYGPDLEGYASREWLIGMISNPEHERFYAYSNDRMPAFHPDPDAPERNRLTRRQVEMLADWLRGDWYEPEPAVNGQ